jgi:Domain of Unknown Function with PDB structure (DUF3857)/Transglutaminase-like superfamily
MVWVRAGRAALALVFFVGCLVQTAVAEEWPPITPEEQALKDVPQQPGAPAVILNREETHDDTPQARSVLFYARYKVLTEAGREYANIQIPYSNFFAGVTNITGRTVQASGSVVPFDGKSFDKTVVRGRGFRLRVKSFTLPDVQVGSIFEYRFFIRLPDNWFFDTEWLVQENLFQKKATFKFIPTDQFLQMKNGQVGRGTGWTNYLPQPYAPQVHDTPTSHWFELDMTDIPPFLEEPYMPPADTLKWRVVFYYQVGDTMPDKYWKDEGKYWNKEVEQFMGRKHGVEEALGKIVAAGDTPGAKARKIYNDVTQLENRSYIPYRPKQEEKVLDIKPNQGVDDVLRQRSGYHDELARLYVAMARAAGLSAWLMWVPDKSQNIFDPHLMSTYQLEAEIAIVELDGKEVFLDPGSKYCPFGLLDWRYTNSQGLRQSGKGTEFGQTPLTGYNQALIQRTAHLKVTDEGRAEGTVMVAFMGIEAMNRRQEGGRTDDEGKRKLLEDEVKQWLPADSEVTLAKSPDWESATAPMVAEFKISCPFASGAGKHWLVPMHLFQFNEKPMFASAERKQAIYFDYPYRESDEVHITLPAGMEVESLPSDQNEKIEGAALYNTAYKRDGANSIVVQRDLALASTPLPPDMYGEIKGFYDKAKTGDDQRAIVKGAVNAAKN